MNDKNVLGQPSYEDVTNRFCDPCNAVTCSGCPIHEGIKKNTQDKEETSSILKIIKNARLGRFGDNWIGVGETAEKELTALINVVPEEVFELIQEAQSYTKQEKK